MMEENKVSMEDKNIAVENKLDLLRLLGEYALNHDVSPVICKINTLIDLDKEEYKDEIILAINSCQIFGFLKYFEDEETSTNSFKLETLKESYKGEYIKYLNQGQLSLIQEIEKNEKVLFSASTTYGKTSIAIEHILSTKRKAKTIVFIVPLKSLLEEIYIKMIKLNKKYSLQYCVTILPECLDRKTIYILTPEKYLLLKEKNKFEEDLIIMDEMYKIMSDDNKGIDKGSRAPKFRRVAEMVGKSNARTIFLSPFTYNLEPSMQLFIKKYKIKKLDRKVKFVSQEFLSMLNKKSISEHFGVNNNSFVYNGGMAKYKQSAILRKFLEGQTIIFLRTVGDVFKYIDERDETVDKAIDDERFDKFLNHIINSYSHKTLEKWKLIEGLEKGIGIHIGPLPRYIKKEMIDLFNRGILNTILVTTSFVEGVNSAAKNIIITSDSVPGKNLKNLDLLNISGRAGRFGISSIGRVYVLKEEVFKKIESSIAEGVTLKNSLYEKNTSIDRSSYDLESVEDYKYMNQSEKEKVSIQEIEMKEYKLTDNDLNVSLNSSKEDKLKLYIHMKKNYNKCKVKKILENVNKNNISIELMKIIFMDLRTCDIRISGIHDVFPPFNSKGEFVWGELYNIYANSPKIDLILRKKNYIFKEYNEIAKNSLFSGKKDLSLFLEMKNKKWLATYFKKSWKSNVPEIDDNKIYIETFKFIATIIEYKIPLFIGLFFSIFKVYLEKNNIDGMQSIDPVEISSNLENINTEENYRELISYGIPFDVIRIFQENNIKNINNMTDVEKNKFDDYQKILLDEFKTFN